jgi:RHS repeat-associated protein
MSDVTYDALGEVTADGLGNSFAWDAEGRLIQVSQGSTVISNYVYDAEGRRIKNASFEFVYDLAGRAITLFNATTGGWWYGEIYAGGRHLATYSGGTTNFLHTDWLGTKRVMTALNGTISQTCTGFPFGDGVNCTGTNWSYNGFTDDVHDPETNLEHTWFRQLSGTQGRWITPDPDLGSMDITNPQSLNRYAYVGNDPVNFLDPLGLRNCSADPCGVAGWGSIGGGEDNVDAPGTGPGGCPVNMPNCNAFVLVDGVVMPWYQANMLLRTGDAAICPGIFIRCSIVGNNLLGLMWGNQSTSDSGFTVVLAVAWQDLGPVGKDFSWWGTFARDLFSWESFGAAQIHAQDSGYYTCLKGEMMGKAAAPAFTHTAEVAASQGAEQSASWLAGAWYHFTDGRFTAWGRYSQVLVPNLASKIKFGAKAVDVVGWAYFDYEGAKAIKNCAGKL